MLYLIGGASRGGKSTLARRLLRERHVPYLPLDALCTISHHARPGFDALGGELPEPVVCPRHPIVSRSEQLWPLVRAVAEGALWVGETCGLEGDVLLPKQVAELRARHPQAEITACFLGYAAAEPRDQLQALRDFAEEWDTWFWKASDEEGLAWVAERVAFSRYLRRECARHGCAYAETAADFLGAQERAFHHLTRPERLRSLEGDHVEPETPVLAVGPALSTAVGGYRPRI